MKDDEATAKQSPTASPGKPMSRKSLSVPRPPSRISMKPSRNAAAQKERQKTMAQELGVSTKRAMAPPKLQNSADRKTSTKPLRSARRETCGAPGDGTDVFVMAIIHRFRTAIWQCRSGRVRLAESAASRVVQQAVLFVALLAVGQGVPL